MALSGICLRQDKGSTLTIQELDDNFRIITGSIEEFKSCTVYVCGNQAISGVKSFSSCIVGTSGFCGVASNAIDSNKIGGTPAACVIFNCGNQTIEGVKSFSDCLMINGGAFATGSIMPVESNKMCLGDTACGFHTVFTGIVTSADEGGLGTLKLCGNSIKGDVFCSLNYFCGNFCGEAATAAVTSVASCVNIKACDGDSSFRMVYATTYDGDAKILGTDDGNAPTFNPSSGLLTVGNVCVTGILEVTTIGSTGNTTLGNQQSDTHQITGSLNISGSINTSDPIFPVILQYGKSGPVHNTGGFFAGGFTEYYVDTAGGANTCNNNGYYFGYDGEIVKISLTGRFLAGCNLGEGIRAYPTVNGVVQTSMYAEVSDDGALDSIIGASSTQASIPFVASKHLGAVIRVAGGDDGNVQKVCGTDYSVTLFVKTTSL